VLNEVTAAEMKEYQIERLKEGAAAKTINLDLSTLRAMLRRNRLWQEIQSDFRMLRVRDDVGIALTLDEEQTVLAGCAKSLSRALYRGVVMALCTCMRASEIRLLKWKQIDFVRRLVTVGRSKTLHGDGRKIPINDRLFIVMQEWAALFPNRSSEHYVFPSEHVVGPQKPLNGIVRYATDPTRPMDWKKAWQAVLKRINFRCRFHDLRHTGCTRMLEAGVPFAVVAEIMGWSAATAILMSKRYGHMGDKARKQAVALLNGSTTLLLTNTSETSHTQPIQ
jgi:integrase